MDKISWTVICCYILLGLAAAVIIFNIFIPPTTTLVFLLPWILILFAYLFIFSYKLDVIAELLSDKKEGEE